MFSVPENILYLRFSWRSGQLYAKKIGLVLVMSLSNVTKIGGVITEIVEVTSKY